MASRKFEGLPEANGLLEGTLDGPVTVTLNGLKFETDLRAGHKTGLYLDQQVNYQRTADLLALSPGARVLDCFSFLGGFALHAARRYGAHVTTTSDAVIPSAPRSGPPHRAGTMPPGV